MTPDKFDSVFRQLHPGVVAARSAFEDRVADGVFKLIPVPDQTYSALMASDTVIRPGLDGGLILHEDYGWDGRSRTHPSGIYVVGFDLIRLLCSEIDVKLKRTWPPSVHTAEELRILAAAGKIVMATAAKQSKVLSNWWGVGMWEGLLAELDKGSTKRRRQYA